MSFELLKLPYAKHTLEPFISEKTIEYHYGKHHRAYVNNLNNLVAKDDSLKEKKLTDIIRQYAEVGGAIFNNAAQVWNHSFYWECLTPPSNEDANEPSGKLADAIIEIFGSFEAFKDQFSQKAMSTFGSGWVWLIKNKNGKLEVLSTSNAANPMSAGHTPLLTCDVWEHAYYLDTKNDRSKYISNFWSLVNWAFVAHQFEMA